MYNAERLLDDYLKSEEGFVPDDYTELLPVFKKLKNDSDTKLLDSVILKANTIINNKAQSDFLDDAYFLIAEANFLKGNFFDAAEFYSYVYSRYPDEHQLAQLSRINKSRALLSLNNVSGATAMLDSALKYADVSTNTHADLLALKTQLLIAQNKLDEAELSLSQTLSARPAKSSGQRWTFLLAQLQEKNNKKDLALANYKRLRKSIAPSELAFHADVKQASIRNELHGGEIDEITLLRTFLNKDLYNDFKDRIFFMTGRVQEQRNDMADALISYKSSVKASSANSNHKGLAYHSLADIYFKSGLYKRALSYYDSSLASLPSSHSLYADIRKKAEGLNHLADKFEKVNFEETLQRIAGLPQDERQQEVTDLIRKRSNDEAEHLTSNILLEREAEPGMAGLFYFNNPRALKQGALDFPEKWGSRILKDDWRYQASGASAAEPMPSGTTSPQKNEVTSLSSGTERRFEDYMNNIPVGSDAIKASNERIAATLYEIGVFYQNNLQDEAQASATLESVAGRFSETSYALPAYYRLYLMKRQTDPLLAKRYENIILTRYPGSEIASIIQHAASVVQNGGLDAPDATYTNIYNLFANKQYKDVIEQVDAVRGDERSASFSSQLDYLYTISMGYNQGPQAFEDSLQSFTLKYGQDSLVTPLVRQHLEYIRLNRESFALRQVALLDNEIVGSDHSIAEIAIWHTPPEKGKIAFIPAADNKQMPVQEILSDSNMIPEAKASIPHYFVVNVFSATANLNPSRFGIGQFNRSRYPGLTIKHQLKVVNKENQLIFVGPFQDKEEALSYESRILPMIKDIMKIPAERYNTFVISQKGLGQLNTREQIHAHIEHTIKNIK